mgnify:CR=1 FL=1
MSAESINALWAKVNELVGKVVDQKQETMDYQNRVKMLLARVKNLEDESLAFKLASTGLLSLISHILPARYTMEKRIFEKHPEESEWLTLYLVSKASESGWACIRIFDTEKGEFIQNLRHYNFASFEHHHFDNSSK